MLHVLNTEVYIATSRSLCIRATTQTRLIRTAGYFRSSRVTQGHPERGTETLTECKRNGGERAKRANKRESVWCWSLRAVHRYHNGNATTLLNTCICVYQSARSVK